ncbi:MULTISPECIES: HNH endonuclease family protein [Gordonia]|uniref:HNH endonuclease family protein n=1 Tax=Gordonia TaxID=2053 RepID=UPI00241670D4|nr:HNH endonuclease family protein [Gordonia sihwensis]WFN91739.1 HNH endonuclease family protein [Gordonia sihwensis]
MGRLLGLPRAAAQRWRWSRSRRRPGRIRLTVRQWMILVVFAITSAVVAVGAGLPHTPSKVPAAAVVRARAALSALPVLGRRPSHDSSYDRDAFGPAWTDDAAVRGGGNACDTRNDILARDLVVSARTGTSSCPSAVASGTLTSPYTGRTIGFQRGRGSAAVQIDHIVPLSYAWDLGASRWPAPRRWSFANDPANLVAVDGASNQAKSDAEPARWMPPLRAFHCQYAVQFVAVLTAYGLPIDVPSRDILGAVLRSC